VRRIPATKTKVASNIRQVGAVVAALTQMPACLGGRIPLDISVGATPVARLTLGGITGNFLLDTGATYSAVDAQTYNLPIGNHTTLQGFSLPTAAGGSFVAEDMRAYRAPPGGQKGRIGTDFFSVRSMEFHYEARPPFVIVGDTACDPIMLREAGFVEIGLEGYYAAETAHLKPGAARLNVPVVGLRIGSVAFPAQVDTGFDDEIEPGIVQINAALLAALRNAGVSMHPVNGPPMFNCEPMRPNDYWQVDTVPLTVTAAQGEVAGAYAPPVLEVKRGYACGGIANFHEPLGQVGASWLRRWGTSVFDGPGERIWVHH
jgi:hypothetical protein